MSIGGAVVSDKHANYLLNHNNATEKDYADLMIAVKKKVFAEKGILLRSEACFADQKTAERVRNAIKLPEIYVLKGGDSNEREISLESGDAVANALEAAGYKVSSFDIKSLSAAEELAAQCSGMKNIIVFPVLHGGFGEDGRLQALLEKYRIPFAGCGSRSCNLVMDKLKSKKLMQENKIPTPDYTVVSDTEAALPANMPLPLIVKPAEEGSTVGISLVEDKSQWRDAVQTALKFSKHVLVEKFINGAEITVGVIGGRALPVIEIQYPGILFDYDAKYEHKHGETRYLCPAGNCQL